MAKQQGGNPAKTVNVVWTLAQPIVEEKGLLLWDVRFVKEGADWFLRVYIDRENEAVSIDDCVAVSRKLSDLLDEKDPIPQSYCLEVSSPGIERELVRPEHFTAFEGAAVVLHLYQTVDGSKEIAGILLGRDEEGTIEIQDVDDTVRQFTKKQVSAVHVLDDPELLEE
jgi:ribosome maturation factor RimP